MERVWFLMARCRTEVKPALRNAWNGKLHHLSSFLVLAYVVLNCFRPMMDSVDIGWHVAQGRWMVEHGAIYRQDVFNYPNLGHPAINEYPLFQVVAYLAWWLGWWGPCLLCALIYVLLIGTLLKATRFFDLQTSPLPAMAIGLMLLFLELAFPFRPHSVTYLSVVIFGIFLLRHREATSWTLFWPLALLQIAWTNSHSGFVLGPGLVAFFGAEMIMRRWIRERSFPWAAVRTWLGAFLLILLACFINPFGLARFYPAFYQEHLESIRAYVGEMEPLPGGGATLYAYITLLAVIVVAMATLLRRGAISCSFLLSRIVFLYRGSSVKKIVADFWSLCAFAGA